MCTGSKVCIIIPVKEISPKFEACITNISNLNHNNFDVTIIDDSKDGKLVIPQSGYNKIKVLHSYSRGPSYARNLAAKETDADLIAFTDSDCLVDKEWLTELLKGLEAFADAAACGGIQKLPDDATGFERKVFLFMQRIGFITDYIRTSKRTDIAEVNHNASCCVIYRRDIFLKEGGFLEKLWPGEDLEFDHRLKKKGYKLYFNPRAEVYHYRPKDLRGFLRMMYRYGSACGILTRMYGIFRKIQILPFLALGVLALFVLASSLHFLPSFFIIISVLLCILFVYVHLDFYVFFLCFTAYIFWNLGFVKGLLHIPQKKFNL